MKDFREGVSGRFIRYAQYDTMSCPAKVGVQRPTSSGQVVLQKALVEELKELGLEVDYGKESVVHGILRSNCPGARAVAFMAHVDTADDVMGNGVRPMRHIYKGGDIVLPGTTIRACDNPELAQYVDSEIITSDGTTLLGADDKAGLAEIMEAVNYLVGHPEIRHGDVEVFFTPDEETGAGMDQFPYDRMVSSVCYTMDGGGRGEVESECFNAATVKIRIHGVSTHLGSGRGRLVNALRVASLITEVLPQAESPEATDGRYGYYHVGAIEGTNVEAAMEIYLRDHDSSQSRSATATWGRPTQAIRRPSRPSSKHAARSASKPMRRSSGEEPTVPASPSIQDYPVPTSSPEATTTTPSRSGPASMP